MFATATRDSQSTANQIGRGETRQEAGVYYCETRQRHSLDFAFETNFSCTFHSSSLPGCSCNFRNRELMIETRLNSVRRLPFYLRDLVPRPVLRTKATESNRAASDTNHFSAYHVRKYTLSQFPFYPPCDVVFISSLIFPSFI